jgi:hypothetical protein
MVGIIFISGTSGRVLVVILAIVTRVVMVGIIFISWASGRVLVVILAIVTGVVMVGIIFISWASGGVLVVILAIVTGVVMVWVIFVGWASGRVLVVILSVDYRNIAGSDVWDGRCGDDTEEDERDKRLGKTHDERSLGGECERRIREQRIFSTKALMFCSLHSALYTSQEARRVGMHVPKIIPRTSNMPMKTAARKWST